MFWWHQACWHVLVVWICVRHFWARTCSVVLFCTLLKSNQMTFLLQSGNNLHLVCFWTSSNCIRPTGSCNFDSHLHKLFPNWIQSLMMTYTNCINLHHLLMLWYKISVCTLRSTAIFIINKIFLQGTKLTFLARSHLAPKFSKVVAKVKKLGAIKKKIVEKARYTLMSNGRVFLALNLCLRNRKGHFTSQYTT